MTAEVIYLSDYLPQPYGRRYLCIGEIIPGYESRYELDKQTSCVYADSRYEAIEKARRHFGPKYRVRASLMPTEQMEDGA